MSSSCGSTLTSSLIVFGMSVPSVGPSDSLPRSPEMLSKLFFSFVMVSHTVLQNSSQYTWHVVAFQPRSVTCWCLPWLWYFVNSASSACELLLHSAPASCSLSLIWSPPAATSISILYVWSSQGLSLTPTPWLRWSPSRH